MQRRILIGIFALIAGIGLAAFGVGELLSGPVPTAVNTLLTDVAVEPVQILRSQPAENGNNLISGWLVRGVRGHGMILLVHSLRSNRVEMLSRARFLNEQGYGALLIDLQAHGETPGDRITFGARESEDVEAAMAYLRNAFPGERLGAIGVSLGAAAIVLAKHPLRLDAVVLESLHPTLREAVENRLRLHLGQFGPMLAPLLLWQISPRLGISPGELIPSAALAISMLQCYWFRELMTITRQYRKPNAFSMPPGSQRNYGSFRVAVISTCTAMQERNMKNAYPVFSTHTSRDNCLASILLTSTVRQPLIETREGSIQ